jgi:hypothetical protein
MLLKKCSVKMLARNDWGSSWFPQTLLAHPFHFTIHYHPIICLYTIWVGRRKRCTSYKRKKDQFWFETCNQESGLSNLFCWWLTLKLVSWVHTCKPVRYKNALASCKPTQKSLLLCNLLAGNKTKWSTIPQMVVLFTTIVVSCEWLIS